MENRVTASQLKGIEYNIRKSIILLSNMARILQCFYRFPGCYFVMKL